MAIDQEAMEEHVLTTGELDNVDDFMGEFFREGRRDRQPAINTTVTSRCDLTVTRPTMTPGVSKLAL